MKAFIAVERRGRYARADDRHLGLNRQFVRAHGGRTKYFQNEYLARISGEAALNRAPGASVIIKEVEI